jgi:hypothetical protein
MHVLCTQGGIQAVLHTNNRIQQLCFHKGVLSCNNTVTQLAHCFFQDASCNNHKAAESGWLKFAGLAETGIGSVICARHSFFMPEGTVNFTMGERYAMPHSVAPRLLSPGTHMRTTRSVVSCSTQCRRASHKSVFIMILCAIIW